MKTLTIILACLLSSSVMAQKKDSTSISFSGDKLSGGTFTTLSLDSTFRSNYTGEYSPGIFSIAPKPLTYIWMTEAKKAMEVTEKDKDGNIKVWIDKKRIVWTSDSTFVLKTKWIR